MDYCKLFSPTHGDIELSSVVPKAFAGILISNSRVSYAEGKYGKLICQEIEAGPFIIQYNTYNIESRFSLQITQTNPLLVLFIVLKNDVHLRLNSFGDFNLREGQFNIAYSPGVDCTAFFDRIGEYQNFLLHFPVEPLREYTATFPHLAEFLQQVGGSGPQLLLKETGWITSKILYIIMQFLECTYEQKVQRLYFDNLANQLLLLLLMQKQHRENDYDTYIQSIYEARSMIEKNTSRHFSISEVAQQVGLDESKLKSGFRQAFGTGLFQFMLQVKMQKAWIWILESNKPIKEIASLTGYTSKQNFLTAFKKYFNATPGSLRKK